MLTDVQQLMLLAVLHVVWLMVAHMEAAQHIAGHEQSSSAMYLRLIPLL
jgi:hypothetical protein